MRAEFNQPLLNKLLNKSKVVDPATGVPLDLTRQQTIWDTKTTGLCVLYSPGRAGGKTATVTFRVCYYLKEFPGRPVYKALERYEGQASQIKAARREAARIQVEAQRGKNPKRPRLADTPFEKIVEKFLEVQKDNRTVGETAAIFRRYVIPEWEGRRIEDIRRSDVMALLDKIAAGKIRQVVRRGDGRVGRRAIGSPVSADATLAQLSKLMNWYALNSDDYRSPIVKGMRRAKPGRRDRFLSDEELRALWSATGQLGVFGASVRAMLLTAQRVEKVESMRRSDIRERLVIPGHQAGDGTWVPDEFIESVWDPTRDDDPAKKRVSVVPLSALAREVIDSVPTVDAGPRGGDHVFSLDGRNPINSRSNSKAALDRGMVETLRLRAREAGGDPRAVELPPWELRDLRRTSRTLMVRAGVSEDVAERCLGHVMGGVRGVYNRHDYAREKRVAFDKLAVLIERIVQPPTGDNVVALARGRGGPRRAPRAAGRGRDAPALGSGRRAAAP